MLSKYDFENHPYEISWKIRSCHWCSSTARTSKVRHCPYYLAEHFNWAVGSEWRVHFPKVTRYPPEPKNIGLLHHVQKFRACDSWVARGPGVELNTYFWGRLHGSLQFSHPVQVAARIKHPKRPTRPSSLIQHIRRAAGACCVSDAPHQKHRRTMCWKTFKT